MGRVALVGKYLRTKQKVSISNPIRCSTGLKDPNFLQGSLGTQHRYKTPDDLQVKNYKKLWLTTGEVVSSIMGQSWLSDSQIAGKKDFKHMFKHNNKNFVYVINKFKVKNKAYWKEI